MGIRTKGTKARHRPLARPLLYVGQILDWADEHHRRTGQRPTHLSGRIPGTLDENWRYIDAKKPGALWITLS